MIPIIMKRGKINILYTDIDTAVLIILAFLLIDDIIIGIFVLFDIPYENMGIPFFFKKK
jgi:hypothetical protein